MVNIPYDNGLSTPLFRTNFESEERWQVLLDLAQATYENGFSAYLYVINDKTFDDCELNEVYKAIKDEDHGEVFVVDKITMHHPDLPILCINLDDTSERFRVIHQKLWSAQNNLVLANIDFEEFVGATDSNGIYRGF